MPSNRTKLAFCATIVCLPWIAAEIWMGTQIESDGYRGMAVPPFGLDPDSEAGQRLAVSLEDAERKGQAELTFRSWSADYGWINHPGQQTRAGEVFVTSQIGSRGPGQPSQDLPAERWRVACFGDSFTYGSEVSDGEDWPAQLEALGGNLEVLNFGVGGWGTDQALLRFRELAQDLQPDVVLIGFCLESMARNVNRYRNLFQPQTNRLLVKPRFRLEGDRLELVPIPYQSYDQLAREALSGAILSTMGEHEWWAGDRPLVPFSNLAKALAATRARERRNLVGLYRDGTAEPYRVSLAILKAFHAEALQAGAKLAAVQVFGTRGNHQYARNRPNDRFWEGFVADLTEAGVPLIEVFAASLEGATGELYRSTHFSPEGNRMTAEQTLGWLRDGLPPKPLR